MSAELLRRAAASEREEWGDRDTRRVFPKASSIHLALAEWLDCMASVHGAGGRFVFTHDPANQPTHAVEPAHIHPSSLMGRALAVARLIVGDES